MNKKVFHITTILFVACSIMAYVDFVISPNYFVKSSIKILLFFILPTSYFLVHKDSSYKSLFIFNKSQIKILLFLGFGIFTLIIGLYYLLYSFFDLSNITKSLETDIGVNKNNFIFVATYIAICNSFLEEVFFRGFAFLQLKKVSNNIYAMIVSSLFFALYHIAMMVNWIDTFLLALITFALFVGGVIFNILNLKFQNIYSSWVVHMFANFAINFIGFKLFGII